MKRSRLITLAVGLAMALSGIYLAAQMGGTPGATPGEPETAFAPIDTSAGEPAMPGMPGAASAGAMTDTCQEMAAHMREMRQSMQETDQRLNQKVEAMNATTGDQKMDAMAAVITELVTQHQLNQTRRMQMMQRMMRHMVEHSQAGESLAGCPALKMMGGDGPMAMPPGMGGHGMPGHAHGHGTMGADQATTATLPGM